MFSLPEISRALSTLIRCFPMKYLLMRREIGLYKIIILANFTIEWCFVWLVHILHVPSHVVLVSKSSGTNFALERPVVSVNYFVCSESTLGFFTHATSLTLELVITSGILERKTVLIGFINGHLPFTLHKRNTVIQSSYINTCMSKKIY